MKELTELLDKVAAYSPKTDLGLVEHAFQLAQKAHQSYKRLSGDPYITHPLAVALILAELEQDVFAIAAALLHDVVEDAGITLEQISSDFGPEVARLVAGVTKLSQLSFVNRELQQAENFRKMFLAMAEDFRIVVIKLADRLHNMRTLKYLPLAKQKATAIETKEIYAPLAHRLGVWRIKWELEDLSFACLSSEEYAEIKRKVAESRNKRETYIQDFIREATELLQRVGIGGEINGRAKHFFSIYHKMVDQNLDFDEIYDLTAVRIIVDGIKDCYAVLGVVHAAWKPIPGRFRDYIAMPKSNGYQSLHTTVIGPAGRPVEIQIRTHEMHRIAEYGIAAHWCYKEKATDKNLDAKMAWFREMLEWQGELKDAKDFMESLKINLFIDEVFVFTPKGDVFGLPSGANPVDFAYRVHTEVGHRTVGAKVNGRIVPLDHKLQSGDIVEILTGKKDNPSRDWVRFVKTAAARVKIKNWFKKHQGEPKTKVAQAVITEVEDKVRPLPVQKSRGKTKSPVTVAGLENVLVRFSKCCNPIPGEKIVGFITKGRGIAIHAYECANIINKKAQLDRLVKVEWNSDSEKIFSVAIEVEAFDRVGLLKDILAAVAETKTNVSAANISTKRGSSAFLRLTLDVKDKRQLDQVVATVRRLADVYEVKK
ncbi:(p)ppGpp synthetase [Candidatus Saganbacteria bacterium CG08_land_8_20_14_0_20_45_16]|uniref:(P)ppGpp synthetase n=1 Tax=Candidatus Saganbacteria bacterium CG08_land_8_20_14_0_20_45_16 TaxID=2014293 RepID=A0A2H0XTA6_UNCSA|nr:MAG: (p)ppGpp synthetase [Candidatus Saganbacteria bacterium CG08_land_8_20_14_0_20_45_16]